MMQWLFQIEVFYWEQSPEDLLVEGMVKYLICLARAAS